MRVLRSYLAVVAALWIAAVPSLARADTCTPARAVSCGEEFDIAPDWTVNNVEGYSCNGRSLDSGEYFFEFTPPTDASEAWLYMAPAADLFFSDDYDLVVMEGACDTAATCTSPAVDGSGREYVSVAPDGTTYYAAVDGYSTFYDQARVGVFCNHECTETQLQAEVTCSSNISGTTAGGSTTFGFYACGEPFANLPQNRPEAIYRFTPQATGEATFVLSELDADQDIYVLEDTCAPSACISSSTNASTATDEVTFTAVADRAYYIVVEAFSAAGNYNLSFNVGSAGSACPEDCDNGIDDDSDGNADCADTDCANDPVCHCPGGDCASPCEPSTEICDFIDNDCDGSVDEDVSNACGGCGEVPVETCDTFDNDCDGLTDEGVRNQCGTCGIPPTEVCDGIDNDCDTWIDEGLDCSECTVETEICDGEDNDCDGDVDEGLDCSACTVETEVCDGVDNDCDGDVDEELVPEVSCETSDVCPAAQAFCRGEEGWVCAPLEPTSDYERDETSCDGLDNDCDGETDEDLGVPAGVCSEQGVCAGETGLCSGAAGWVCPAAGYEPFEVSCDDGLDNDCDGDVDESCELPAGSAADGGGDDDDDDADPDASAPSEGSADNDDDAGGSGSGSGGGDGSINGGVRGDTGGGSLSDDGATDRALGNGNLGAGCGCGAGPAAPMAEAAPWLLGVLLWRRRRRV